MSDEKTPRVTWDQGMARLQMWTRSHGHSRVPQRYVTPDGYRLGKFVHNQRTAYRMRGQTSRHVMTSARIAALEALPGWSWRTKPRTLAAAPAQNPSRARLRVVSIMPAPAVIPAPRRSRRKAMLLAG